MHLSVACLFAVLPVNIKLPVSVVVGTPIVISSFTFKFAKTVTAVLTDSLVLPPAKASILLLDLVLIV